MKTNEAKTYLAEKITEALQYAMEDGMMTMEDLLRRVSCDVERWEVAAQECGGSWDLIDEAESLEAAIASAKLHSAEAWHDDAGNVVFGITSNPNGSGYEHRLTIYDDGTAVLETDGAIVGTV